MIAVFERRPRDRNGLEVLDRAECLRLLADARIGRLAYIGRGLPSIIPVNIALDEDQVVFRLSTGGALVAINGGQLVALEVDQVNVEDCCGWSVTVVGLPAEVPGALAGSAGVSLACWLRSDQARLFRLGSEHVEGRRLLPGSPTTPE